MNRIQQCSARFGVPNGITAELKDGNMKVLVAGATGAIGRPLVSALMAARHEVIGMSSSEHSARSLRAKA
jgi:FlaA1/EpsC-like NDP-sugar epimerase